ncbi:MAG: hypothetical protein RL020_2124 [Pseudomonadota bacterium]|jgi:hypothetical protein
MSKFNFSKDWPVCIALIGAIVGILGTLGIVPLPLSKVWPVAMLIISFGFLFYKGQHMIFWKIIFFLFNVFLVYLSFKI